ncbi:MAG: tetratricopeptide repeat protein [bacterium]|nr:hypothetical protein [Deltaproteobacteria bacterium]MCP4242831.1 tetratricopeptide repeat protein [bacterium]
MAPSPGYGLAHTNLANTLRDRGDLPGAIVHYRRAIAIDPENETARRRLAAVLEDRAKRDVDSADPATNAASSGW